MVVGGCGAGVFWGEGEARVGVVFGGVGAAKGSMGVAGGGRRRSTAQSGRSGRGSWGRMDYL